MNKKYEQQIAAVDINSAELINAIKCFTSELHTAISQAPRTGAGNFPLRSMGNMKKIF